MGQNQERLKNQVKYIMRQSMSIEENSSDSDDDSSLEAEQIFSDKQDRD